MVHTVLPTVPARADYALTPLGKTLLKTVSDLANSANVNRREIERARKEFDRREAA